MEAKSLEQFAGELKKVLADMIIEGEKLLEVSKFSDRGWTARIDEIELFRIFVEGNVTFMRTNSCWYSARQLNLIAQAAQMAADRYQALREYRHLVGTEY